MKRTYCPQCGDWFDSFKEMQSHLLRKPLGHQSDSQADETEGVMIEETKELARETGKEADCNEAKSS